MQGFKYLRSMRFSIKVGLILSSVVLLLAGCNGSQSTPVAESPSPTSSATPSPTAATTPTPDASATAEALDPAKSTLISGQGIGAAQLGMPFWKLKELLGAKTDFTVESPFIVDFDAIAVRQGDEVQYYILYLAGQTFTDDDIIQGLLTENPKYQTAEGVGPGTALSEAEKTYGKATLSYHTQNESREYARFDRQPANNISFGTGNGNVDPAGIYPSPTGEYNETKQYRNDAKIQSALVVCLTENCSSSPSDTTPPSSTGNTPPAPAAPESTRPSP